MSLVINHNMMAANAAKNLNTHYASFSDSTRRLSSGLRINSSSDDAAGLAIRELQRADIRTLQQGTRNANDAISLIQTADGALAIIDEKLIRMKELAEQAATGTYDSTQRLMIDSEFQAMAAEINRIANSTEFNGIHLLNGNLSGSHDGSGLNSTGALKVHFGTGNDSAEDYYYVEVQSARVEDLFNVDASGQIESVGPLTAVTGDVLLESGTVWGGYVDSTILGNGTLAYIYADSPNSGAVIFADPITGAQINSYAISTAPGYDLFDYQIFISGNGCVAAWVELDRATSNSTLYAQRFDNAGYPLDASPILIASSSNALYNPTVSYQPDGSFAIAVSEEVSAVNHNSYMYVVDKSGTVTTTPVVSNMGYSDVISLADGRLARFYSDNLYIHGIITDGDGITNPVPMQAISHGWGWSGRSSSVALQDGSNGFAIFADDSISIFNSDGTIRSQTPVNGQPSVSWPDQSLTILPSGHLVAVWGEWDRQGNGTYDVYGQIFNADGTAFDSEFKIDGISGWPYYPIVSADKENGFTVTYAHGLELYSKTFDFPVHKADFNIRTQDNAQKMLEKTEDAIIKKDKIRAHLGALQNRLENTISNLNIQAENLQMAESRISDVDVATEMTTFTKSQILTQAATAMLAQANSLPKMALQVIGG